MTPLGFLQGLEGQRVRSGGDDLFLWAVALWEPFGYKRVRAAIEYKGVIC